MGWAAYAGVLRGKVLHIKDRDFVSLAVTSGCSKLRIMLVHIFPNIVNTLIILVTLRVGIVIIAEASLSFLGWGSRPRTQPGGWWVNPRAARPSPASPSSISHPSPRATPSAGRSF